MTNKVLATPQTSNTFAYKRPSVCHCCARLDLRLHITRIIKEPPHRLISLKRSWEGFSRFGCNITLQTWPWKKTTIKRYPARELRTKPLFKLKRRYKSVLNCLNSKTTVFIYVTNTLRGKKRKIQIIRNNMGTYIFENKAILLDNGRIRFLKPCQDHLLLPFWVEPAAQINNNYHFSLFSKSLFLFLSSVFF